jgi:pimeloyl-ACP methyl ester carboxylesterase
MYKAIRNALILSTFSFSPNLETKLEAQTTPPAIEWERTIEHSGTSKSELTSDGGYIFRGKRSILKTDSIGELEWETNLEGDIIEENSSIHQTQDGGYITPIISKTYLGRTFKLFLLKTNSLGEKVWRKNQIDGYYRGEANSVQTVDGGYITACSKPISFAGSFHAFLIKTDENGETQWEKDLNTNRFSNAYSVKQSTDEGYIIAGNSNSNGFSGSGSYTVKTDSFGNIQWYDIFGKHDGVYRVANSVVQTSDGGFATVGSDLIKYSADGELLWQKSYPVGESLAETSDGGFIIVSNEDQHGDKNYIRKADFKGEIQWEKELLVSKLISVHQTADNGFTASGIGDYSVDSMLYLVKLAPESTTPNPNPDPNPDPEPSPEIKRLAKWNQNLGWEALRENEISEGDLHVLVHGWSPFETGWVDENSKLEELVRAWHNPKWIESFQPIADAIQEKAPNNHVLAYSWIDDSAKLSPSISRASTYMHGEKLSQALQDLGITTDTQLHLLGHSHGARVATVAAIELENSGYQVHHLTLWDSPELGPGGIGEYKNASNLLDLLFEKRELSIGTGSDETFVDNYYSLTGISYNGFGIINVNLPGTQFPNHSYPKKWYAETTPLGQFALNWSPLILGSSLTLHPNYKQDSNSEFNLLEDISQTNGTNLTQQELALSNFSLEGNVIQNPNGFTLTESSPAFIHSTFLKGESDRAIEFTYNFVKPGDGDQLVALINNELRFLIPGDLIGSGERTESMEISGLAPGRHSLSIGLQSTGQPNAQISIYNLNRIIPDVEDCPPISGKWQGNSTHKIAIKQAGKFASTSPSTLLVDCDYFVFSDNKQLNFTGDVSQFRKKLYVPIDFRGRSSLEDRFEDLIRQNLPEGNYEVTIGKVKQNVKHKDSSQGESLKWKTQVKFSASQGEDKPLKGKLKLKGVFTPVE